MQPGVGGPRTARDVYLVEDERSDGATNDAMLIASDRSAAPDPDAYGAWLRFTSASTN